MGLGVHFGMILAPKLGPSWAMLGTKLAYNGSSTSLQKLGGEKELQLTKGPRDKPPIHAKNPPAGP